MATAEQVVAELERAIGEVVGSIASSAIQNLSRSTVRDTSYHASRWVGRVGGLPASRDTPATRAGRAASVSFAQQSSSISAVANYQLGRGNIFIGNDGSAIEVLETRKPFVEAAIARAISSVNGLRL